MLNLIFYLFIVDAIFNNLHLNLTCWYLTLICQNRTRVQFEISMLYGLCECKNVNVVFIFKK